MGVTEHLTNEEFLKRHRGIIYWMVGRWLRRFGDYGIGREDLMQEAVIGALQTANDQRNGRLNGAAVSTCISNRITSQLRVYCARELTGHPSGFDARCKRAFHRTRHEQVNEDMLGAPGSEEPHKTADRLATLESVVKGAGLSYHEYVALLSDQEYGTGTATARCIGLSRFCFDQAKASGKKKLKEYVESHGMAA